MTVSELIARLQLLDPDARVFTSDDWGMHPVEGPEPANFVDSGLGSKECSDDMRDFYTDEGYVIETGVIVR